MLQVTKLPLDINQLGSQSETQAKSVSSPSGVPSGGLKRTHHRTSYVHWSLDKYRLREGTTDSAGLEARSEVRQRIWDSAFCGRVWGQARRRKALILERDREHPTLSAH